MSLVTVLRSGVPEHALACAAGVDRLPLENVSHLTQQVVSELDLTRAQVDKTGDVYTMRLPWSGSDVCVTLTTMREIESYSPFRIVDVCVKGGENTCVVVLVATENKRIEFTEVDIVRLKRKRMCGF